MIRAELVFSEQGIEAAASKTVTAPISSQLTPKSVCVHLPCLVAFFFLWLDPTPLYTEQNTLEQILEMNAQVFTCGTSLLETGMVLGSFVD